MKKWFTRIPRLLYQCADFHGPLTRHVKLWVAHAPGMLGTFLCDSLQKKVLISDPSMYHGTCVTHVLWCMSGLLTRGGGDNVPGACTTHNFTYLLRGPCYNGIGISSLGLCSDSDVHSTVSFFFYLKRIIGRVTWCNNRGNFCYFYIRILCHILCLNFFNQC